MIAGLSVVGAAQRQQHIRPKVMAEAMASHRKLHHDHRFGSESWFQAVA